MQYEWKSESGACEACQELDGTVYDTASDIPDRPHPNCKCWIEVLEREKETTDPIELRREQAKDKKHMQQELAKLLGDVKSLEEEIDEYMKQIEEQEEELNRIERAIDTDKLETADRRRLADAKEQIDFAKNKTDKAKQEIAEVKKQIGDTNGTIKEISKLEFELEKIKIYIDTLLTRIKLNIFTIGINIVGRKQHDAAELWNISVDGIQYNNKYIQKNGEIANTLDDLQDNKLKLIIQNKIIQQMNVNDSRGIIFDKKSTLAQAIQNSREFQNFIRSNKTQLLKNEKLENKAIEFKSGNLKHALHRVDIIDTYIDKSTGNLHTKILDTYDFNPNEKDWKVKTARELQEKGEIQTYYTVTEIIVPKQVWINY